MWWLDDKSARLYGDCDPLPARRVQRRLLRRRRSISGPSIAAAAVAVVATAAAFADDAALFIEPFLHGDLDFGIERGVGLERVLAGVAALGELGALVADP